MMDIPLFRAPTSWNTILGSWTKKSVGDNAAVAYSESDNTHWRFSTLSTPFSVTGNHPVSGAREWGIKQSGSSWVFYTRGADRTTGIPKTLLQDVAFGGGSYQEVVT